MEIHFLRNNLQFLILHTFLIYSSHLSSAPQYNFLENNRLRNFNFLLQIFITSLLVRNSISPVSCREFISVPYIVCSSTKTQIFFVKSLNLLYNISRRKNLPQRFDNRATAFPENCKYVTLLLIVILYLRYFDGYLINQNTFLGNFFKMFVKMNAVAAKNNIT